MSPSLDVPTQGHAPRPVQRLGILGSGQLGRFLAQAAQEAGLSVCVLSPEAASPAHAVLRAGVDTELLAPYTQPEALAQLAAHSDVVTLEFENIPLPALQALQPLVPVCPSDRVLAVAQDRWLEKSLAKTLGLPVAPVLPVASGSALAVGLQKLGVVSGGKAVLKSRRLGYDGKGQRVIAYSDLESQSPHSIWEAFEPCLEPESGAVLEAWVPWTLELSVGVARQANGKTCVLVPFENHHENGILSHTVFPARVPESLSHQVVAYTRQLAEALDLEGLLCVEWFATHTATGWQLAFNEMAPRPHNSGHLTMNWQTAQGQAVPSQYQRHVEALLGQEFLPTLGEPLPAVMVNVLGDHLLTGPIHPPGSDFAAWLHKHYPNAYCHWYDKPEARVGRKMAHITVVATHAQQGVELLLTQAMAIRAGLTAYYQGQGLP
ncbi:MAG: ATP-grasp domain-containing protein [Vampirovibrionales bacterium]